MMKTPQISKIAIYCGSNLGKSITYSKAVIELADALSDAGITVIYGGAKVGLMGILADQMLKNGGKVIGVIPKSLADVEIAHENLTELHITDSMHERKSLMAKLSDGFIMLPGGSGSLDEFFEIFTWAQLGYHLKPCGILNINHYYNHLLRFLDHVVTEGFMKQVDRHMFMVENNPMALIQKFKHYQAPVEKKWITQTVASKL